MSVKVKDHAFFKPRGKSWNLQVINSVGFFAILHNKLMNREFVLWFNVPVNNYGHVEMVS